MMREWMFRETRPAAAVFVGGMEGIREEFNLLAEMVPEARVYPFAFPGGEAARLPSGESPIGDLLSSGSTYPSLAWALVEDLARLS